MFIGPGKPFDRTQGKKDHSEAIKSLPQKTYEAAEKSKSRSKMGASAIIVTTNVPQIADMCRKLLQLPVIVCNVVEAIGTRDAVNVTVSCEHIWIALNRFFPRNNWLFNELLF